MSPLLFQVNQLIPVTWTFLLPVEDASSSTAPKEYYDIWFENIARNLNIDIAWNLNIDIAWNLNIDIAWNLIWEYWVPLITA